MRPIAITPDVQKAFAIFNAGVTRSRREYAEHPTAFAVDSLCETCQTELRNGRFRKGRKCQAAARQAREVAA